MSNAATKASQFNLKSLVLSNDAGKSLDIRFLTNDITMTENMSDGFISGKMNIFDGLALYHEFPLRGQEYLDFEVVDYDNNSFKGRFFVFAIDNLKPVANNNDHMMQYTLHFASIHKVYNEAVYIRQAFRNQNIHEYAKEVFDGAFVGDAGVDKPLIIDPTDNQINVIAPAYNPIMLMHFFARKAYSNKYQSGTFRFYETRNNFQFRNHESIMEEYNNGTKTAKKFGVNMIGDSSPEGQLVMRQNLINFDLGTHVNSIRDLSRGIYNRTVLELDYDNRTCITSNYKHLDNLNTYTHADNIKDVHDSKFNDLAYHPAIIMVNKNWLTPYDPSNQYSMGIPMTADIIAKKQTAFDQFHDKAIHIKIHGDLSINAGDMIELNMPVYKAKTDERDPNNPYNGKYIVDQIQHVFINDEYYQNIRLGRLGVKN